MLASGLRRIVALSLAALVPLAMAQNTGVAVVFGTGSVSLNGATLANSNAVVPGDVIQTRENGTATISASGSSVVLEANTIVRFQGQGVALDRGAVWVATGQKLPVDARDFSITPVSNQWTQFYITRASGSIGIMARKNDVVVNCGSTSVTVKAGQQLSRPDADNCGLISKKGGAPPAANGPIVTSGSIAAGAFAGAVGIVDLKLC